MRASYEAPRLMTYGPIDDLTAVFGHPSSGDVAYNLSGDVIQEGSQSVDSCPTENATDCVFNDTP